MIALRTFRRVLVPALVTSLALYLGGSFARRVHLNWAAVSWVPVAGKVVSIENQPARDVSDGPYPRNSVMRYAYSWRGKELHGETFAFISSGTIEDAILINDYYSVGQSINVLVNSSNPAQSVVVRRATTAKYIWKDVFVILAMSVLSCILWIRVILESTHAKTKFAKWHRKSAKRV